MKSYRFFPFVIFLLSGFVCNSTPISNTTEYVDSLVPESGHAERYCPSLLNTLYKPLEVEVSIANAPVNSRVWHKAKTRIVRNIVGFTPGETQETYRSNTNKYGSSLTLPRQEVTGRFYTKKIEGRWWIVDPEGYLHINRGVCSVRPGGSENNSQANFYRFNRRFANITEWLEKTKTEFDEIGMNCSGAFSRNYYPDYQAYNKTHCESPFILTPSFNFLAQFSSHVGGWPRENPRSKIGLVLHPDWENWCREYVRTALSPYKDDPNTLGIFSDNEIEFVNVDKGEANLILPYLIKDTGSTGTYVRKWCTDNGIDPDNFSATVQANKRFVTYAVEKYYKAVGEAIKEFDPGMLYLGSRLHGEPRNWKTIWEIAGRYCDIVSVNYYGDWSVDMKRGDGERTPTKTAKGVVPMWETWSGKPFIVTEFYTKGIDDSDLNNESGAGIAVRNQAARAYAYQHFTLGLIEARNCVGWHWFKYQDDEPEDNSYKAANKGIYDKGFKMYPYLGKYIQELNIHTYELIEFFDSE